MADIRKIIQEHLENGDAVGWFEKLYQHAAGDPSAVPWARMSPRKELLEWILREHPDGTGQRALVIGCGLGDDAQLLSELGFDTTAFDVSETAIHWCQERFPESKVHFTAGDLFAPPPEWIEAFDFVLEAYIVQALHVSMRRESIAACARFVTPGGRLLAIGRGIDDVKLRSGPPWPLTPEELAQYEQVGLTLVTYERRDDPRIAPVYRYWAEYRR